MNTNEPVITVEEMRAADAYTISHGTPSLELMHRAAMGVFNNYDWAGKRTLIYCGSGNNGGDGYALAQILAEHGHPVVIIMVSNKMSEDGRFYWEKCMQAKLPVLLMEQPAESAGSAALLENFSNTENAQSINREAGSAALFENCLVKDDDFLNREKFDVIVDCILGTGFSGSPRGNAKTAIEEINSLRPDAEIISVDINSGMNGNTGQADIAVKSDLTVSIGYLKTGFFRGRAEELIGRLVNVDIGISLPE